MPLPLRGAHPSCKENDGMARGRKLTLTPTLIVLLVLAGALTIIGILVWLRKAPSVVPTQPGQSRSGSSLQAPASRHPLLTPAVVS
jgi:hypothetical protein